MSWGYWPPYVPVAQKINRAKKEVEKLRKKGRDIKPVEITGRAIAHSFWGKAWCAHMEKYHDFENRLGRGRSYVRHGAVIHLDITPGKISALVAGTHTYKVEIAVKLLLPNRWRRIKEACAGQISSLMDVLRGNLSDGVMQEVTNPERGLFPEPEEVTFSCSCPDWAEMCKHVAAAIYGVGARLDSAPELLFLLRGVDHTELVGERGVEAVVEKGRDGQNALASTDLASMFDIELVDADAVPAVPPAKPAAAVPRSKKPPAKSKAKPKPAKAAKKAPAKTKSAKSPKQNDPDNDRLANILRLAKEHATEKKRAAKKGKGDDAR